MTTETNMANRAVVSIDNEIKQCLENLNTWSTLAKQLIQIKRNLVKNNTDDDLFTIVSTFSRLYYSNDIKPENTKLYDTQKYDTQKDYRQDPQKKQADEEDIDEILRNQILSERKTVMEKLSINEQDEMEMMRDINKRREKLKEQKMSVSKPIQFQHTVDDEEEVVEEEVVKEVDETDRTNDVTDALEAAIHGKTHPLLQMQLDNPIFQMINEAKPARQPIYSDDIKKKNVLAEIAAAAAKEQIKNAETTNPFSERIDDPPVVDALLSITYSQREELLQRLYQKAKKTITNNPENASLPQEKILELTRAETTRLLNLWKATH